MLFSVSVPAATAVLNYDLFQNERKRVSSRPRIMTGVALVGSAAINDTEIDVYIEDAYIGRFRNSHAGVVGVDASYDIKPTGARAIPAGSQVSGIVVDAPATNPLLMEVHGREM